MDDEQHLQPDPLTAPFVMEAFERYANGAAMTQIRDWLNGNGVKNKRGLAANYNSVQHMLSNRRYIGEFRYRDVVIPNGIPDIVPEELFGKGAGKNGEEQKGSGPS